MFDPVFPPIDFFLEEVIYQEASRVHIGQVTSQDKYIYELLIGIQKGDGSNNVAKHNRYNNGRTTTEIVPMLNSSNYRG